MCDHFDRPDIKATMGKIIFSIVISFCPKYYCAQLSRAKKKLRCRLLGKLLNLSTILSNVKRNVYGLRLL